MAICEDFSSKTNIFKTQFKLLFDKVQQHPEYKDDYIDSFLKKYGDCNDFQLAEMIKGVIVKLYFPDYTKLKTDLGMVNLGFYSMKSTVPDADKPLVLSYLYQAMLPMDKDIFRLVSLSILADYDALDLPYK